jgi:DNA-directed RNA polymerase specialized sigma24 family protein
MKLSSSMLAQVYGSERESLVRYVARSFPRKCHGYAEDAVSEAFAVAANNLDAFGEALEEGGERRVVALLRVIAWRSCRASTCRGWGARAVPVGKECFHPMELAGQEFVTDLRLHLRKTALSTAADVLPSAAERLADAVLDRLGSGDTDGEVAARHGLRREYLNCARRRLEARVKAEFV